MVDRRSIERNVLTRPLKQIGVRTVTELNAEELAAKAIKSGDFDVVFIEFNTLMDTGRELAESFRKIDSSIPIVVAYPSSVTLADLKKYCPDVSACLMTPFTNEQLRETVRNTCHHGQIVGGLLKRWPLVVHDTGGPL